MGDLKTYGEIYDEEFLKKFGKYRDDVAKTKLEKEFEVDVDKIAELCKIHVSYKDLDAIEDQDEIGACKIMHSERKTNFKDYETIIELRTITINKARTEEVKRFNLAHEIGHILIGNLKIPKNVKNNDSNQNLVQRLNELNSAFFANELLLPEVLIIKSLEKIMKDLNYDSKQNFSENDIKLFTEKTANLMKVPRELLKLRIDRLNVFN